jgi:hypothetical protein
VIDWVSGEAKLAISDPKQAVHEFWDTFGPGGRLHPRAFLESQGHLVIEALLLVAIVYLVFHSRNPPANKDTLTDKVRHFSRFVDSNALMVADHQSAFAVSVSCNQSGCERYCLAPTWLRAGSSRSRLQFHQRICTHVSACSNAVQLP